MQITKWLLVPAAFAALAACERADEDNAALNVDANLATDNMMAPADNLTVDANNVTVIDNNTTDGNVTDNTANNTVNAY